jgi:hypothetical protein
VPSVAAMAGHSPRVCLERYAHVFAEAQLGSGVPMVEAIEAARAELDVRLARGNGCLPVKEREKSRCAGISVSGGYRARTGDLYAASVALSQLS